MPSDMRQHILETVNVIDQKRSLKGEPYLWQNGYILNIKKRKRCFRFGCCYICRLHKKVLPLNAILKWYFADSHICVILISNSRSVKTCFWGLIGFSEWIDLWLIAVKRESWLKYQDQENQRVIPKTRFLKDVPDPSLRVIYRVPKIK